MMISLKIVNKVDYFFMKNRVFRSITVQQFVFNDSFEIGIVEMIYFISSR